jgi:streptogramin lyase
MRLSVIVLCSFSVLLLTGCSLSSTAPSSATLDDSSSAVTIHGIVHGGQQPVAGTHIYLFAPNTTGYGGNGIAASAANASLSMLNSGVTTHNPSNSGVDPNGNYYVTTDSKGNFSISSDYSCTTGYTQSGATATVLTGSQPVYLYAVGGNSGAGVNSAAGLLASLGPCSGLSSGTSVFMDEVTTIAMAYAAAGFATDATHISSSGTSLALTGISNAFANTTNLVGLSTGAALATTPGGNGTVPQALLYTLANILAICINSTGPTSPQCGGTSGLLTTATSTGAAGGTVPTDTATAAINIAHYPGSNVGTLFGLPNGQYAFASGLTAPPNDFTVRLAYSGNFSSTNGNQPHSVAIDASGNAWYVAAGSGCTTLCNQLIEFSPLGVASTFGVSNGDIAFSAPQAVAVDVTSSHVLVANSAGTSVTNFIVSSSTTSNIYNPTNSGISKPTDVAVDGSGNIWVANNNNGAINLLKLTAGTGAVLATATGNGLSGPLAIAVEPGASGNVWVVGSGSPSHASVFTYAGAAFAQPTLPRLTGSSFTPVGASVAIDSGGFAWVPAQGNEVAQFPSAGTAGTGFAVGTPLGADDDAVAIDGAGDVWVTDADDTVVWELNNSGTNLSGTNGYTYIANPSATAIPVAPDGIAIDGSGNVWYSTQSNSAIYELIGAAVPVVTPIASGVANSTLGTRP